MKILHTADLHLGLTFIDAVLGYRASEERRLDLLANFDRMVDKAIREEYDFFLISGDIFQTTNPSGRTFVDFSTRIGMLSDAGVQIVVIPGNHDIPKSTPSVNMTRGLAEARAPKFHLQSETPDKPLILESRDGRKVGFLQIPYLSPQSVVHLEDVTSEGELAERYNAFIKERIDLLLEDRNLEDAAYRIILAHGTVAGASYGSERSFISFEIPIWTQTLLRSGINYVAMGHIHLPQTILGGGCIYYPGSIERMTFGEEGQEKKFITLEEEKGELKPSYHTLPCRPMLTIKAPDLAASTDPTPRLKELIDASDIPKGAMLRLLAKIPRRTVLKTGDLEESLQKKRVLYHIIHTEWAAEPEVTIRPRDIRSVKKLIEEQLQTLNLDERVRRRALRYAEQITGEVEEH
ncbi:MAG: exonuclease SbcCD subunit D [Nitrososphaerales archaeon]